MSQPNTCEVCGAEYYGAHACEADRLLELLEEANDVAAACEPDADRLDWLDEHPEELEYLWNASRQVDPGSWDVRAAIDELASDEEEEDEDDE